jgi:hypothetical protein
MVNKISLMEAIVEDCGRALFQKWANALPESERTEENLEAVSINASESAVFVIKMFMDKFNEAAEDLKSIDDSPSNIVE